jgi:hypothetical protein
VVSVRLMDWENEKLEATGCLKPGTAVNRLKEHRAILIYR